MTGNRRVQIGRAWKWSLMIAAAFLCQSASDLQAENWAFQRSYYSHHLPPEVAQNLPFPESRSAYRVAYKPFYPGITVRSSFRFNRIQLRSGSNFDTQYIFEGHVQFEPPGR